MGTPHAKKLSRNIIVVAFVALASGFGQDLITPILPAFLLLLGIGPAGIGLIDGLLQGTTSLFRFISGVLSDRLQTRKRLVFLGYALSSISRPLLMFASSFWSIAFLRGMDGVGKGTKDAPRDALVADSASAHTRGRAFGFHRLVDTAGSVFGPFLAGALLLILGASLPTYRLIFALAIIPGAIALLLIWFGIREPAPTAAPKVGRADPLPWPFWIFTIGTAIAMLTKINDSLFLLRAVGSGIPSAWIPMLFAGFTLLYALLSYPIGIWSDRFGKLPFIAAGWFVLAVAEFAFSFQPTFETAIALFALVGLFYALTEGSGRALIADLVPTHNRGSAYAIFHTVIGLCVIVGGAGLGTIWSEVSPSLAFRIGAGGSVLACLVLLLMKTRLPKTSA